LTASYRLVHFTPDPFTGARLALGAVVVERDGRVRVAKVNRLPLACLGDRGLQIAVMRLHARLDGIGSLEALPSVFGPYATLGEPVGVPDGVPDPLGWVDALLNPERPQQRRNAEPRGAHRANVGYRFFETWKVSCFVHKTFRPRVDGQGWLAKHAVGLPELSHWVAGPTELLLMEPVVPARPRFEADLKEIAQRVGAYRYAVEQAGEERKGRLLVYLTAGGPAERRAAAREALTPFAHEVVDTDDERARDGFVAAIRRVGSAGELRSAEAEG
jgi:hypothetical protein